MPTSNPINTSTQNSRHYSQALQSQTPFKREQAIILNVDENLIQDDYLEAIGNIVGPLNVKAISKMSNNRMCLFLSSVQHVENLVNTHETIKIKGRNIGIRRLITPAKRLILSNVCPTIPHSLLENLIKSLGYKTASPMSFLRVGTSNPLYNHVISFRRQIYVIPDEKIELPSSKLITHEDVSYRIFLTFDVLKCFLCSSSGHIASQCPQQASQSNPPSNNESMNENPTTENTITNTNMEVEAAKDSSITKPSNTVTNEPADSNDNTNLISLDDPNPDHNTTNTGYKRQASSITSTEIEQEAETSQTNKQTEQSFIKPKNKTKKIKKSKSQEELNVSTLLMPAKKFIEEKSPPFILNFNQLVHLFENLPGTEDKMSFIKSYSNDLEPLITMLYEIHPHLGGNMKTRITKLQKKIKGYLLTGDDGSDSEISISSQNSQQ